MIEHKPECPATWGVGDMPDGPCTLCEMLSACEERVLNLNPIAIGVLIAQRSRERALDAVREAVDGLDKYHHGQISAAHALAAIDALRGERK